MPRNCVTVLREFDEQYFSKSFSTYTYDNPNGYKYRVANDPRYSVTIHISSGSVVIQAYPEKDGSEVRIFVKDPDKKRFYRYFVRYFNWTNEDLANTFKDIYDMLCDFAHIADVSMDTIAAAFVEKLAWM